MLVFPTAPLTTGRAVAARRSVSSWVERHHQCGADSLCVCIDIRLYTCRLLPKPLLQLGVGQFSVELSSGSSTRPLSAAGT